MYAIVFTNYRIAENVSRSFRFLVKLQAAQNQPKIGIFRTFSGKFSSVHPWTVASEKLEKENMGKALFAKSK